MIVVQSLALVLLAAVVAAFAGVWLAEARVAVRQRVVVNLSDGSAVDGVLLRRHRTLLVLGDATLLVPSSEPSRVDGELLVERSQVLFVQAVR
ncbi:hypothetical protein [Streptomyces sp. MP131-18]|uniref:hypothetical protein n=1 Tax=Streptomyces sp. MP131-18 TaxID=1857892 RepID=UPI0009C90187|nr:hypothetical protein [Streptomyces sp. MP131-18]ONK09445.1 hypothetical protein STBA_01450 [Streptomyces sp. MP131-18]